jgi:hypothetical protein
MALTCLTKATSRCKLRLCGWTSPSEATCSWQLAPKMAPILAIIRP